MSYKSLCVVPTDWGDLRDQIFSRTGFAPSGWPFSCFNVFHSKVVFSGLYNEFLAEGFSSANRFYTQTKLRIFVCLCFTTKRVARRCRWSRPLRPEAAGARFGARCSVVAAAAVSAKRSSLRERSKTALKLALPEQKYAKVRQAP